MRFLNTGRLYINKRFWELDCKDNGYFKALQSITHLFKLFSLTSLIYLPCLGLRFHTVYFKCRKIQKTLFTPLIVVNLSSSSILQVEQQKVTVFSLLFNFIHATSCRLYSWLILSVQKTEKMIYFDLLHSLFSWQFRIHCMSALWIAFRVTYIWYTI